MQARHLVTTADERTWPADKPLLFLGQWCQRWSRREIWQSRDFVVAQPYGMTRAQKDSDLAKVSELEDLLLPQLATLLDEHHATSHKLRYWQIVLGHWLRRYLRILINRLRTLEQCLDRYEISGITLIDLEDYTLSPQFSVSTIWDSNDNLWNQILYSRLLEQMGEMPFPIQRVWGAPDAEISSAVEIGDSLKLRMANGLMRILSAVLTSVKRREEIFILNSYLPKLAELRLHLLLRQPPYQSRVSYLKSYTRPDESLRARLAGKLLSKLPEGEAYTIGSFLFDLLPVCYLEGYQILSAAASTTSWPKEPAVIFTSNNFDTDELFKFWTAAKVESGARYIVGQHGNNYGTHRHQTIRTIEELTSDRFLTWGWKDGLPQHFPTFIFKTVGRKPIAYRPHGDVLLVQLGVAHQVETWDVTAEFEDYLEDQLKFVQALPQKVIGKLLIRLYRPTGSVDRGEEPRWREFNPSLALDKGKVRIDRLLENSRLVVFSYDSTGLLENLSRNFPTIAFWQNGLDHVRDSALPYYHQLVDVGIFHLSPESAAAKVAEVFNDVSGWWMLPKVQKARERFCQTYAAGSNRPLRELTAILKSEVGASS